MSALFCLAAEHVFSIISRAGHVLKLDWLNNIFNISRLTLFQPE